MRIRTWYIIPVMILLLIEVCIAIFVKEPFVRGRVGDFLVVILIYCFLRLFPWFNGRRAAITTFAFACLVEFLQYADIVGILGLQDNRFARIVIGTNFSWEDILAYALGTISAITADYLRTETQNSKVKTKK